MDLTKIRHLLDTERSDLSRDGEVLTRLPLLTRVCRGGSAHEVVYSRLGDADADEAIVGEVEHHRRLGVPFEWKAYAHDGPSDLLNRLRRDGLTVGPCEAVLVLDLRDIKRRPQDAGNRNVVRIGRPDQVEDYRRVTWAAFGRVHEDSMSQLAASIGERSTQVRGYIAYAGSEPVCAGRLYTHSNSRFAGLYGGGTRPEYRDQGYYRAVVAARVRDAAAHGAQYVTVDALPTSRPVLERMGFQWLTDTWPCEWQP